MIKMKEILIPSCSETVSHLGIKPSEIPYIKKRVKELIGNDEEFLEHFTDWVGKPDGSGDSWISEGCAGTYDKIKDELLAKRQGYGICPFCEEKQGELSKHIKKNHREEIRIVLRGIDAEEYKMIRKEILLESL